MSASKYTEDWLEREFIGYGLDQPDPQWPGGAKICVSFVVQYYMGAELNLLEGDATCCNDFLEIPARAPPAKARNESNEMMYEFGAREGVPRLLNLFNKYKTPVTWNMYTRAIEKEPYWVKPIMDSGAEISCGGHRYRDNIDVPPEEEEKLLEKSIDVLQEITGDKTLPRGESTILIVFCSADEPGWLVERRSNMSTKLYSLAHQRRSLPHEYSSDSCQDDLPYWVPSPTKEAGLLMIPFTYDTTDLRFNMRGSGWASPKDWFIYLKDSFDCLYDEGVQGEAKMMTVLLHPHIVGRPNRTIWLEEFIKYVSSKEDAWIARRIDIADHWKKTFPYDPKTAFGQTPVEPCGQISIPS